jgi:hypothetical protein
LYHRSVHGAIAQEYPKILLTRKTFSTTLARASVAILEFWTRWNGFLESLVYLDMGRSP